jgi:hypothetical protein
MAAVPESPTNTKKKVERQFKIQLSKQEKLPLNYQEKRRDALFAPPQRIEKRRQSVQSVLKMSAKNTAMLCVSDANRTNVRLQ